MDLVAPNLGMKLKFFTALVHHGANIQCIDRTNIQIEIEFRSLSQAWFTLWANPSIEVMESFCRRLWGNKRYDRTIVKPDGIFTVRFHSISLRD